MPVPLCPHSVVVEFGVVISEDGHVCPMMESVIEGLRACSPHEDLSTFAALFGNGSDAPQATECLEVSQSNGVVCVGEESGEDKGSDAGKRGQDSGVGRRVAFGIALIFFEPCFEILI